MVHREITLSPPEERRLGEFASKAILFAGGAGVALLIVSALLGFSAGWERFLRAWLTAFMFVLSICLGGLFFVMLQHAVKAGWSVVLRRLAEGIASNLMWIWMLFIPVVIGMFSGVLYDWVELSRDATSPAKYHYYLTPTFWLIRAVAFFAIWAILARFFVSNSIAQDATGEVTLTRRMEKFAPLGLILYALSQSYAAMDWMMTLESEWFSTMFPVYHFAAGACGFFATLILIAFIVQHWGGRVRQEITAEHYQDAGKLLFAFGIVFWAYIAFSQYMLIWYANIPEETPWYLARQIGGWGAISLLLLFGHFAGPFVAIISRHPKRRAATLALAAGWMLFMHFIDIYWLVMPHVPAAIHDAPSYQVLAEAVAQNARLSPDDPAWSEALNVGYGWHIIDFTLALGMLGLIAAGAAWRLSSCALIPEQDPRLEESLAFENI